MATYLLKKSYQLKNLKEIMFKDLWGDHGVFTTMWILSKPPKIIFFKDHIDNLIKSSKVYGINNKNLKKNILTLLKFNLSNKKRYNHLLRIALTKKVISISLRKRFKPKINLNLKLIKLKRSKPEYKNLKYKKILSYLSKLDNSKFDIGLVDNGNLLETGTSNILLSKNNKLYSPVNNFYRGITLKTLEKKLNKIYKRNIYVNNLDQYEEIILLGSGKGIASVANINSVKWKRKSFKFFNLILKKFNSEMNKSLKIKL